MSWTTGSPLPRRGGRMTKWKGIAASLPDMGGITPCAGLLAALIAGTGGAPALAGCVTSSSTATLRVENCTGTTTGPVAISEPARGLQVNVSGTASGGSPAMSLSANALTFNGLGVGAITSSGTALQTSGNGASTVKTDAGFSLVGATALNHIQTNGTGDLTLRGVLSGKISGTGLGTVTLDQRGTSNLNLFAYGTISNTDAGLANGVALTTSATAGSTSLQVNDVSVSGTGHGIDARYNGTNWLTISATGDLKTGGNGINLTTAASAAGNVTVWTDKTVEAGADGINAAHGGSGRLRIMTYGPVTAGGGGIVAASNAATAGDTWIETGDVTSRLAGIRAVHKSATSDLIIDTYGSIVSTASRGIDVSPSKARNVAINAGGDVSSAASAIRVEHTGSGDATVTSAGRVDSSGSYGINVITSGKDLTIAANEVSGAYNGGIRAYSTGTGSVSVTATGPVTSANGAGITTTLANTTTGSTTIETQGPVSGLTAGISAYHSSGGLLSLILHDRVTAGNGFGIDARSWFGTGNSVVGTSVSGTVGILARNYGGGLLSIVFSGSVTGTSAGAVTTQGAVSTETGGNSGQHVRLADVQGAGHGILTKIAGSGASDVEIGGLITAAFDGVHQDATASSSSARIAVNNVRAGKAGVLADHAGSGTLRVETMAGGAVEGGTRGIDLTLTAGALDIAAAGSVTGLAAEGVRVSAGAAARDATIGTAEVSGATDGINATHQGTGDLTILGAGPVTGLTGSGIRADHTGSGALSIQAAAKVTGQGADGIAAESGANSTGQAIEVAEVSGSAGGVSAVHRGSGNLSVRATGTITGLTARGLDALSSDQSSGHSIDVAAVQGFTDGIFAAHAGTGDLSLSASGPVSGSLGSGIEAETAAGAGGLSLEVADVSGARNGIIATHAGSGDLSVRASGAVAGSGGNGILASTAAGSGGVSVDVAGVSGSADGISIDHDGRGALSLRASGAVTGAGGSGILASSHIDSTGHSIEVATVSGGTEGIFAEHLGTGDLSIRAAGPVAGAAGSGIIATTTTASNDLALTAGNVSGGSLGIGATHAGSGALTLSADVVEGRGDAGIAASAVGSGLSVAAGRVTGATYGIFAAQSGAGGLSVAAGAVTGGSEGIAAIHSGSGTIGIVADDVSGGADGILATHSGNGALQIDAGTVSGGGYGIGVAHVGTGDIDIAADAVTGALDGIRADHVGIGALGVSVVDVTGGADGIRATQAGTGALHLSSSGLAKGIAGSGIRAIADSQATGMQVAANTVEGGVDGLSAENRGGGATLVTAAAVSAARGIGLVISSLAGTTDLRATLGRVTGDLGIRAAHEGTGLLTLTATDSVTGRRDRGIDIASGATTTGADLTLAGVSGATDGLSATHAGSGALSIRASGAVEGDGGSGILASTGSAADGLAIAATSVSGTTSGISADHLGRGELSVKASDQVSGTAGSGVSARTSAGGGGLSLDVAAVRGATDGISATHAGSGDLSIRASGAVEGDGGAGIIAQTAAGSRGLSVDAATVTGGTNGISASHLGGGDLTIRATGRVSGATGSGVLANTDAAGDALAITVAGVSGGQNGIAAGHFGSGALSIRASGAVTGTGGSGVLATTGTGGGDLSLDLSRVSGASFGVNADHLGTGKLSIRASDWVTGATQAGIRARSDAGGTGLSIEVAAVRGGLDGISAGNLGAGDLSIRASGAVEGEGGDGISAATVASGGALAIEVAGVSGAANGISAAHGGKGALSIEASGLVAGAGGDAIAAAAGAGSSGLAVKVATARGGVDGINALHEGAGGLTIAAGSVTGLGGAGIRAITRGTASGLAITARAVAGKAGIIATHAGRGSLGIDTSGAALAERRLQRPQPDVPAARLHAPAPAGEVVASSGDGIEAVTGRASSALRIATGAVRAAQTAIHALHYGTDALEITAGGAVAGADGIIARHAGAGLLTITASDVVGSRGDAIEASTAATAAGMRLALGNLRGAGAGLVTDHRGRGRLEVTLDGIVRGGKVAGILNAATGRGGHFTIARGASVSAGSGLALVDLADGRAGPAGSALEVIGQLGGSVRMGQGTDVVTIRDGAVLADAAGRVPTLDGGGAPADGRKDERDALVLAGGSQAFDTGNIRNFENLTVARDAALTLTDRSGQGLDSGNTAEALQVAVETGATLAIAGPARLRGHVANAGATDLSGADPTTGTRLDVAGDWSGNGTLILDASLAGPAPRIDQLTIGGNASGRTTVIVRAPQVDPRDIVLAPTSDGRRGRTLTFGRVKGTASADLMTLQGGPLVRGRLAFRLQAISADEADSGNWEYALAAEVLDQGYAYPLHMAGLDGVLRGSGEALRSLPAARAEHLWTRLDAGRHESPATAGRAGSVTSHRIQRIGYDDTIAEGEGWTLTGGPHLMRGEITTEIALDTRRTTTRTDALGLGLGLSWRNSRGLRVDLTGEAARLSSDIDTPDPGLVAEGVRGSARTLSLSLAQTIALAGGIEITPSAHWRASRISLAGLTEDTGATVQRARHSGRELRLGIEAGRRLRGSRGDETWIGGSLGLTRLGGEDFTVRTAGVPHVIASGGTDLDLSLAASHVSADGVRRLGARLEARRSLHGGGSALGASLTAEFRF